MVRHRTGAGAQTSDETILIMVMQMIAASNLDAINRFCGLDIHHSTPVREANLFPTTSNGHQTLLMESTLIIDRDRLRAYMLLHPDRESLQVLVASVNYVVRTLLGE